MLVRFDLGRRAVQITDNSCEDLFWLTEEVNAPVRLVPLIFDDVKVLPTDTELA